MRTGSFAYASGEIRTGNSRTPWRVLKGMVRAVLPEAALLILRYFRNHGRLPNVFRPSAFTEKTLCKMLFDRNPLLPVIADKLAVRDFVRERVGDSILNPIYAVYDRAEDIRLDALPDCFVLKANHGSQHVHLVTSAADKKPEVILPVARSWLAQNYGAEMGEWTYRQIPPRLFAEAYLGTPDDAVVDYKFFCFDGEPRFIKVIADMLADTTSRFFDLEWNLLDVMERQRHPLPGTVGRPDNLEEMLGVARRLSRGFDFIRVDLYNIDGRVVFGELTNYHNAAVDRFRPRAYDRTFGAYWKVESMTYLPRLRR